MAASPKINSGHFFVPVLGMEKSRACICCRDRVPEGSGFKSWTSLGHSFLRNTIVTIYGVHKTYLHHTAASTNMLPESRFVRIPVTPASITPADTTATVEVVGSRATWATRDGICNS